MKNGLTLKELYEWRQLISDTLELASEKYETENNTFVRASYKIMIEEATYQLILMERLIEQARS